MSEVNFSDLAIFDALQSRYIHAVNNKNMQAWADTFSTKDEVSYICTTAESERAGLKMCLIMDDNRRRIEDRITYVNSIWEEIYADYETRHFVQRTHWSLVENGQIEVQSNFLVVVTPSETGTPMIFSSGHYIDRIEINDGKASFISKKVIMDTPHIERFMAYPI